MEVALTKLRWDRHTRGFGKERDEPATDEEEKLEAEMEHLVRGVVNKDTGEFDLMKQPSTDMRSKPRIILPDVRCAIEEADLMVRKQLWIEQVNRFRSPLLSCLKNRQ